MGAAAILTILRNGETIKTLPVEGDILVGRGEACVIRLEDRAVSRQHALVRATRDGVQIEKKNEFAPLIVNGAECTTAALKEGDVVSIGPYLMKLSMPKPESAPATTDVRAPDTAAIPTLEAVESVVDLASQVIELPELAAPEIAIEKSALIEDDARTRMFSGTAVSLRLVFQSGDASVEHIELDKDEISIGRGKGCDVVLNDKKSSRRHVLIRRAGQGGQTVFKIKDLSSANGTFLNGAKISEAELSGDDSIRIGDVSFLVQAVNAEYSAKEKNFMDIELEMPPDQSLAQSGLNPIEYAVEQLPLPESRPQLAAPAPSAQQRTGFTQSGDGLSGIAGIAGVGSSKKGTLLEKFRALPKRLQILVAAAIILGLSMLDTEDGAQVSEKKSEKPVAAATSGASVVKDGKPVLPTFESLPPDKKKFVEAQHLLAFELYKNGEYDKAIFEIQKIFAFVNDYLDAREIERYSREAKRKLEAQQEEKRRKDEEQRQRERVNELVAEVATLMQGAQYAQAELRFVDIMSLDPENLKVGEWRRQIQEFNDKKREEENARQVREQVNQTAREQLKIGQEFQKDGKCFDAIDSFEKTILTEASDRRIIVKARAGVAACKGWITDQREPILEEARTAEQSGEFAKAYKLFEKASEVDSSHPGGFDGMERIRGVLTEKARGLYTEAVLAESFSDFEQARAKFEEIIATAPKESVYHERAKRKLGKYMIKKAEGS